MFIERLSIHVDGKSLREIKFSKGVNLIVDETSTDSSTESGNNVGKTSVLRLVDFCLAGGGSDLYRDPEFKATSNKKIEEFLTEQNVVISIVLSADLDDPKSKRIKIRRNFLKWSEKIQEVNGESIKNDDFQSVLKSLIFHSSSPKPTFRQLIARNIRYDKNRLKNTLKVLNAYTSNQEYEALFLSWLGIDFDDAERKQKLVAKKNLEEKLQARLRKENTFSQIKQSLLVVERNIERIQLKKKTLNINENYERDSEALNRAKESASRIATRISRLEVRKNLISESAAEIESEHSDVDLDSVREIYAQASALMPEMQRTFEQAVWFHNQVLKRRREYIESELPVLEKELHVARSNLHEVVSEQARLHELLMKSGTIKDLEVIVAEINDSYELKGALEEQKRLWESSLSVVEQVEREIAEIDEGVNALSAVIERRIAQLNESFVEISEKLYDEQFILCADEGSESFSLQISSVGGNPGTGKKKGEIAAFDLAYIKFADSLDIPCLHFLMHDQLENIHDNQMTKLLSEVVMDVDCQFTPVLHKFPRVLGLSGIFQSIENMQHLIFDGGIGAH